MVFTMESGDLSIFPGFYAVDRIATISQLLVESLDKEDLIRVSQLSIYLVDSSNLSTIHALAKDMAMILPQITKINFSFERRCAIVSVLIDELMTTPNRRVYSHLRR